jgi:hypothetical protein
MIWRFSIVFGLALLSVDCAHLRQSPSVLQQAAEALGANGIRTLGFEASGVNYTVGQNFTPNDPWPPVTIKSYKALINYESKSMRVDLLRSMGPTMPRGGGVSFTGDLPQTQVINGDDAWNHPVSVGPPGGAGPATPCTIPEAGGTSWAGPGGSPGPAPAPESQIESMLMLWATPQGFIKAANANSAQIESTQDGTVVSFTIAGKYKMIGIIRQNQVEKVQTWIEQSLVGDMLIETQYGDYKDFGGVQFPQHILQTQDGFPSLDLTVSSVTANPYFEIAVPDNVRNATAPQITVNAQKIADGVFWLNGGTHHSLAVEMSDQMCSWTRPTVKRERSQ